MIETPKKPYARVIGRFANPDLQGRRGRVTFTPSVEGVVNTDNGTVFFGGSVTAYFSDSGEIIDGKGNPYVDLVGLGHGVTPNTKWAYHVLLETTIYVLEFDVFLEQGKVHNLNNLWISDYSEAPNPPDTL